MPGKLICSARGSGGVEDGFQRLDDGVVQFMLVKFPVGSGTFKRNKFVYVHHIGPHCPAVKRGKWNEEEMTRQAMAVLEGEFCEMRIMWLFANQAGEKTLLARKKLAYELNAYA